MSRLKTRTLVNTGTHAHSVTRAQGHTYKMAALGLYSYGLYRYGLLQESSTEINRAVPPKLRHKVHDRSGNAWLGHDGLKRDGLGQDRLGHDAWGHDASWASLGTTRKVSETRTSA